MRNGNHVAQERGRKKLLGVLYLIPIIYYEVSGGPFGVEGTVGAGGPLLAILGFLVFPLVWSMPEALLTAELACAFPENSGCANGHVALSSRRDDECFSFLPRRS